MNAQAAETINSMIEILVEDSDSYFLNVTAEIQDIKVTLNRYSMEFPTLYAGNVYNIYGEHLQGIILENYGNIPTNFSWENIDTPSLIATFNPQQGTISPKSSIKIHLKFVPRIGQNLNQLLICNIEGLNAPTGFELTAQVDGLSVSYEYYDERLSKTSFGNSPLGASHTNPSNTTKRDKGTSTNRNSLRNSTRQNQKSFIQEEKIEIKAFEKIELLDLQINLPKVLKFSLKNTSGIPTKFNFYMENFEPLNHKEIVLKHTVTQSSMNSLSKDKIKISFAKDTKFNRSLIDKDKSMRMIGSFIGDEHEKTHNFTSVNGQEMNKMKLLNRDQKFFLTNNKGVAVVCEPNKGVLSPQDEVLITVTIYNDTCGQFEVHILID